MLIWDRTAMNRQDFSRDAPLLDVEIDDFDTRSYREEGSHPTGINDTRMRLPTRYDISKYYLRNRRNPERGRWRRKSPEDLPDISDDFEWQITYSFPSTLRNPETAKGAYGGAHVTFRRLYLILCEHFNGGNYFIDDYFDTVYPYTVKPEVDDKLESIKAYLLDYAEAEFADAVVTKAGTFDRRYKVNRGMKARLRRYESFAQEWEDSYGEELASMIKNDIIECMKSGQLQLECIPHVNAESTLKKRRRAGLNEEPVFLATSQLIESLQLYVRIGGNRQWRTSQGILV